jgi:hypothetical protein
MKKAKRKTDVTAQKYLNVDESNRKFKNSSRTILMIFFFLEFCENTKLAGSPPRMSN